MRSSRAVPIVFAASAAVLVIEIVAARLMAPYVGISLETFTAIIGTILAGIAGGAALGGWVADHHHPRRWLGPALALGGVLTWTSLPIVAALGPTLGPGSGAIVVLAAAAFLAPAVVLSAVSPMVAKLRLDSLDETGTVVGRLSAAGTVGALAGTFVTGFVLVAALPSRIILLVVGAALVVAGGIVHWRLQRSRPPAAAVAIAVIVASVAAIPLGPCELETAYFCGRVEVDPERPSGRALYLDRLRHAYVDLDDPTHLELRYVRLLADVADALPPGPLEVLHVGGGGFSFPRQLAAVRPGTRSLVLEIDPALVELARDELGLETSPLLEVRVGDARLAFGELPDATYDLVVGDAFGSESVPWHLTTAEVAAEIHRVLRPDGVYAMNIIDGGSSELARAQLATLATVFDHVAVIVPPEGVPDDVAVNQILVASDAPLDDLAPDPGDGEVIAGDELEAYVGDAMVLTDEHAPADVLVFP